MRWLACALIWLAVAAMVVGCAIALGPVSRVSVVFIALFGFAGALIATIWISETSDR